MSLFTAIFGGSRSESGNRNNDLLTRSLSGVLGTAGQGAQGISSFLGGDSTGFNNYKRAAGFDWLTKEGSKGILGNMAARGLLRSGAAGRALVNYGNEMTNTYANDYMKNLLGLSGIGLQAGGVLANSGQYGKDSKDTGAFGSFLGSILSDIRLKENIEKVYDLPNGIGVYTYNYKFDKNKKRHAGVMAQEVARLLPQALGPDFNGYKTVNYDVVLGSV